MGSVHIRALALNNQIVKMKFLVILSACVAISTGAPQFGPIGGLGGFGRHIGAIGGFPGPLADVAPASAAGLAAHPNGAVTPVETPSVLAARRDHLIAKDAAFAAAGPFLAAPHALPAGPIAAPLSALGPAPAIAPAPAVFPVWTGPLADNIPASLNGLVGHPNGAVTPIETPSVAAARRDHLIAKDAAFAAAAPIIAAPLALPAGPIAAPLPALAPVSAIAPLPAFPLADTIPAAVNGLVAHPNGAVTPVETPSVSAARHDHLVALDSAFAAAAPIIAAPLALPAGPIAAPLPAIAPAARGFGPFPAGPGLGGFLPGPGPTGGLVAHPNGAVVPVDEPAVAAARGAHLAHFG